MFLLECWMAMVPSSGFHALPEWARLLLPAAFVAAAFREPNWRRSTFVVVGIMFLFVLNRERFGYGFWLHPVVWACSGYFIFVGIIGKAPARFENKRLLLSAVVVTVMFVAFYLRGLF